MEPRVKAKAAALFAALLLCVSSAPALAAGYSGPGAEGTAQSGYTGPGAVASVTTVAAALQAADDTPVVLTGHISKQLRKKHYEFKDESGTIEVEIGSGKWPQQAVSETTQVRLYGKVEHKKWGGREVEVKRVDIVP